MTLVKICGITEIDHATAALEAGADMLGFVFAPSRRQVAPDVARKIIRRCRDLYPHDRQEWLAVGVFAGPFLSFVQDAAAICGLDAVQLSGEEPLDFGLKLSLPVFKVIHVSSTEPPASAVRFAESLNETLRALRARHPASRLLLDSAGRGVWGGTGRSFDWRLVGQTAHDCIVAGGLDPSNVGSAISTMRPWAVDVSSGVETDGRKDPDLIRRFISAARRTDKHEN